MVEIKNVSGHYEVYEHGKYMALEIIGFNSGHRLAYFEFNNDGSFRLED